MPGLGRSDSEAHEAPVAMTPVTFVRRKSKVSKGEGLWLMSFSDMSLILMSFFVLQLAYSNPDKRKYDNLNAVLTKKPAQTAPDNLETMSIRVKKVIKAKNLEKVAEVTYDMNGLSIEFKDATLFRPGSAEPNPAFAKVVDEVMSTVAKAPGNYKLTFEGHTDDVPVAGKRFRSNWDLASARGVALLNSFKARGVAEQRMAVVAYAHTRPKVKVQGLTGEALKKARAANRRVVIRLE